MATTTIVIIALAALCLLSIGANVAMLMERKSDRLDKEYLIKQGAIVETRLLQLEEECKTERGKFGWAVAALKESQAANASLKKALKMVSKDRWREWTANNQTREEVSDVE